MYKLNLKVSRLLQGWGNLNTLGQVTFTTMVY